MQEPRVPFEWLDQFSARFPIYFFLGGGFWIWIGSPMITQRATPFLCGAHLPHANEYGSRPRLYEVSCIDPSMCYFHRVRCQKRPACESYLLESCLSPSSRDRVIHSKSSSLSSSSYPNIVTLFLLPKVICFWKVLAGTGGSLLVAGAIEPPWG